MAGQCGEHRGAMIEAGLDISAGSVGLWLLGSASGCVLRVGHCAGGSFQGRAHILNSGPSGRM